MNIGIVNIKYIKVDDGNGGKKEKPFLEMSIRAPFMQSATFTITKNKDTTNQNAPDFFINYSYNRRGESYPRVKAGALWKKTSESGLEYIGGHIESPLFPKGKLYIAIYEAKQREGMPQPTHRHDVVWSPPKNRDENQEQNYNQEYTQNYQAYTQQPSQAQTQQANPPVIEIDDDEIPF